MKKQVLSIIMLLALLFLIAGNAQAFSLAAPKTTALVYVTLSSHDDMNDLASTGLPIYTLLDGAVLVSRRKRDRGGVVECSPASASRWLTHTYKLVLTTWLRSNRIISALSFLLTDRYCSTLAIAYSCGWIRRRLTLLLRQVPNYVPSP